MISKLSSLKNKNAFTLFDADNKHFYDTAPTRAQNKYQYVALLSSLLNNSSRHENSSTFITRKV
jgi:hypothetical protein